MLHDGCAIRYSTYSMNVVFDLGGVVVNWHVDQTLRSRLPNNAAAVRVKSALVRHSDWSRFDICTITPVELAANAAKRSGFDRDLLLELLHSLSSAFSMIDETVRIIRRLRATGHRTFCLSNMPSPFYAKLVDILPFDELFEGRVISSEIGLGKPDEAIFSYLLECFQIDRAYTIFFDDHPGNCEAARLCGIAGAHFTDAASCLRFLESRGVELDL